MTSDIKKLFSAILFFAVSGSLLPCSAQTTGGKTPTVDITNAWKPFLSISACLTENGFSLNQFIQDGVSPNELIAQTAISRCNKSKTKDTAISTNKATSVTSENSLTLDVATETIKREKSAVDETKKQDDLGVDLTPVYLSVIGVVILFLLLCLKKISSEPIALKKITIDDVVKTRNKKKIGVLVKEVAVSAFHTIKPDNSKYTQPRSMPKPNTSYKNKVALFCGGLICLLIVSFFLWSILNNSSDETITDTAKPEATPLPPSGGIATPQPVAQSTVLPSLTAHLAGTPIVPDFLQGDWLWATNCTISPALTTTINLQSDNETSYIQNVFTLGPTLNNFTGGDSNGNDAGEYTWNVISYLQSGDYFLLSEDKNYSPSQSQDIPDIEITIWKKISDTEISHVASFNRDDGYMMTNGTLSKCAPNKVFRLNEKRAAGYVVPTPQQIDASNDAISNLPKINGIKWSARQAYQLIPPTPSEIKFEMLIKQYALQYKQQNYNEIKIIRQYRANAICDEFRGAANTWQGTVKSTGLTASGKSALEVVLPDGTLLGTWSDDNEDQYDHTMVFESQSMTDFVKRLTPGETINFTGDFSSSQDDCFKVKNTSDEDAILSPDFVFRFRWIRAFPSSN